MSRLLITLIASLITALSFKIYAGVTAEQVLGEYWKDPLFGQAASEITVQIDVLDDAVWPTQISIPSDENIRLVFINKSKRAHLIAISEDLEKLRSKTAFQQFVTDELFHASQKPSPSGSHSHDHSNTEIDATISIVKTVAENPTVLIPANGEKEMIVKAVKVVNAEFQCVISDHNHIHTNKGEVVVRQN